MQIIFLLWLLLTIIEKDMRWNKINNGNTFFAEAMAILNFEGALQKQQQQQSLNEDYTHFSLEMLSKWLTYHYLSVFTEHTISVFNEF